MRRAGWIILVVGLIWTVVGVDNVLNDSIAGWKFHRPDMAWRSLHDNGVFYGVPGLLVTAIGGIIVLREWWKRV